MWGANRESSYKGRGTKLKKKFAGPFLSGKKKGENGTRSRQGRNKEREDNEVVLGNIGSETGRL